MEKLFHSLSAGPAALLETLLLFGPAPLAYLWLWPNVDGGNKEIAQVLVYVYFLAGVVVIGRRRWSWDELGLSWRGWQLGLAAGILLSAGRWLVVAGVDWGAPAPVLTWEKALWDIVFYFLVVGLVEELLFRGLIYHAFETWHGAVWAVIGSSLVFGIYHFGSQGIAGAAATAFLGAILALARNRGAGLIGLAAAHGLMDLVTMWNAPAIDPTHLQDIRITQPLLIAAGYVIILAFPIWLWRGMKSGRQKR
jgi:membrane protease YdiL (CAAX protease family)